MKGGGVRLVSAARSVTFIFADGNFPGGQKVLARHRGFDEKPWWHGRVSNRPPFCGWFWRFGGVSFALCFFWHAKRVAPDLLAPPPQKKNVSFDSDRSVCSVFVNFR